MTKIIYDTQFEEYNIFVSKNLCVVLFLAEEGGCYIQKMNDVSSKTLEGDEVLSLEEFLNKGRDKIFRAVFSIDVAKE